MIRKIGAAFAAVLCFASAAFAATPEEWYSLDGEKVLRNGKAVESARPRDVTWAGEAQGSLKWFPVHPSVSEEMEGSASAVWVCNPENPEHAPTYLPMPEGVVSTGCYDVVRDVRNTFFVVCVMPWLYIYDNDGEIQAKLPGFGPLFRIDDFRFLYTSCVPDTQRGTNEESDPWKGAAVTQVLQWEGKFDILTEELMTPTPTADYNAMGIEGDQCVILESTVASPEAWDTPDAIQNTILKRDIPAAG